MYVVKLLLSVMRIQHGTSFTATINPAWEYNFMHIRGDLEGTIVIKKQQRSCSRFSFSEIPLMLVSPVRIK